jgi:hypothetical protein
VGVVGHDHELHVRVGLDGPPDQRLPVEFPPARGQVDEQGLRHLPPAAVAVGPAAGDRRRDRVRREADRGQLVNQVGRGRQVPCDQRLESVCRPPGPSVAEAAQYVRADPPPDERAAEQDSQGQAGERGPARPAVEDAEEDIGLERLPEEAEGGG